MDQPSPPTIVLLGMMGSGKTTVGRALSARTGWSYVDNDELVHVVTGRAPEEIAGTDGVEALHEAEVRALRHALSAPPPFIAGAAGSVATHGPSVELLRSGPVVVYLRARPATLRGRVGRGAGRREDATDLAWLQARHAERDLIYQDLASLTIDTDEVEPGAIVDRILEALSG